MASAAEHCSLSDWQPRPDRHPWHAVRAEPAQPLLLLLAKRDLEEQGRHCEAGDLGVEEETEGGKCAGCTTGSRMSTTPRRPRPTGDSRPEQNNDLALSERDQQQVGVNGGGGDTRERSGSRRGRRRVASLRGGEKGRARQNQGQVGTFFTHFFLLLYSNYKALSVFFVAGKLKKI